MRNIFTLLKSRGLFDAATSDELETLLGEKPIRLYLGFDPTADSLHLGHFMGIVVLAWFKKFGHEPIALVGGATGMVGDPSGKSVERNLLDEATLEKNIQGISRSLKAILKSEVPLINNYRWFEGIGFIEFIRDVGKHFRMGTLLSKESVKARLSSDAGLSFTEFSYQLLQAYDFLHLFDHEGVVLQVGGSDQWGNIVGGTELIRKMRGKSAYGLTFPLLTRSDGKKFGKSEEGAIWLNPDRLSPYDFYQYFYKIPDADVINLMKKLTFVELEEIAQMEAEMKNHSYKPNTVQERLAAEVTRLVHGDAGLEEALRITRAAKPGAATQLDLKTLSALAQELPSLFLPKNEIVGTKIVELVTKTPYVSSKSEARRLFNSGGVYLNNKKLEDENYLIKEEDLIEQECMLLSIGKRKKIVIMREKI